MKFLLSIINNFIRNLLIFLREINKQNFNKIFHALKNEDPKSIANNIRKYFRIRRNNPAPRNSIKYYKVISKIPEGNLKDYDHVHNTLDRNKKLFIDIFFDQAYFLRNGIEDDKERESLQQLQKFDLYEICLSMNSPFFNPLFDLKYYNKQVGQELKIQEALNHFFINQEINPSPLFDISFYRSKFLNNKREDINTLLHYLLNVRNTEYLDPNPLFYSKYYLDSYPDIRNSNMNPLAHYLEFGYKENRNPNPVFNVAFIKKRYVIPLSVDVLRDYLGENNYKINKTSQFFDGEFFVAENKIKVASDQTPLEIYLTSEDYNYIPSKLFDPIKYSDEHLLSFDVHPLIDFEKNHRAKNSFVYLPEAIMEQWRKCNKLESLINKPNESIFQLPAYQLPAVGSLDMLLIKPTIEKVKFKPDIIILISTMRRGGAELFNMKIVNSILDNSDKKILLMYTDNLESQADEWLPQNNPNFTHIDFYEIEKYAPENLRVNLIKHLIESLKPEFVLNTNSRYGWDIYRDFGKSLSKITNLDACLFCYDYDVNQNKAGYPREYFRPCLPFLNKVITDNQEFISELKLDFGLTEKQTEKLVLLNQPPDYGLSKINQNSLIDKIKNRFFNKKPFILWASRMAKQKRPDILLKVANQLPEFDFHVWGKGDINAFLDGDLQQVPNNVHLFGAYDNLSDVNYMNASLFMHTASWDGIPTMLIDMMNIGLPIVAPDIGGISTLVNSETGWLIDSPDNVDAYVSAIKEVFTKPKVVEGKLNNANELLKLRHSEHTFNRDIQEKLNYYSNE